MIHNTANQNKRNRYSKQNTDAENTTHPGWSNVKQAKGQGSSPFVGLNVKEVVPRKRGGIVFLANLTKAGHLSLSRIASLSLLVTFHEIILRLNPPM